MEKKMVTIPKEEYEKLKMQANVDVDLLKQLIQKKTGQSIV